MRAAFKHIPETRARTTRAGLVKQLYDAVEEASGNSSKILWWKVKSLNVNQIQYLLDEIPNYGDENPDEIWYDHDFAIHTDLVYTRKK
jgi:hypothetical protein